MSRLKSEYGDIYLALKKISPDKYRHLISIVCKLSLVENNLLDKFTNQSVINILNNVIYENEEDKLSNIMENYDNLYYNEYAINAECNTDKAIEFFRKARSISALLYGIRGEEMIHDVIYEAIHSSADQHKFERRIIDTINKI